MGTQFESPNLPRTMDIEGLILHLTSKNSSGNTPSVENLQKDLEETQAILARLLYVLVEFTPGIKFDDWHFRHIFGDPNLDVFQS